MSTFGTLNQINSHLNDHQRNCIMDDLKRNKTPRQIQQEWDVSIHHRDKPSLKTIYQLRKELWRSSDANHKKPGPKSRSVLTASKLVEIKNVITENPFIKLDSLKLKVKVARTTCHIAKQVLKMKKYNAFESPVLTESHCLDRVTFCRTYIRWNSKPQQSIWW